MRSIVLFLIVGFSSNVLLTACAGNSPSTTTLLPGSSGPAAALFYSGKRVRPSGTCTQERREEAQRPHEKIAKTLTRPNYLYVADGCGPVIDVLYAGSHAEAGQITAGLSGDPFDVFVDSKKNLYAANFTGGNVTEYAPGNWTAPSFTYSVNVSQPLVVTADVNGNVYEGDTNGYINEFYQGRNFATIASCRPVPNGYIAGVAVDTKGDVFADVHNLQTNSNSLVEYVAGLNNCGSPTVLPLPSGYLGQGIALDKNGNLLIANNSAVEVVDAPNYNAVNATIGQGFSCAQNVRLNRANTLAFVGDPCSRLVTVVNYPSGTNAAVLGSGNGITLPFAAVDSSNAVY